MRKEKSKTDLAKARQLKREGRIDFSDQPELTDEWFKSVTFGPRPPKVMLSMRVDADVMAFFRESIGPGYQSVIHDLLRRFVEVKKAESDGQKGRSTGSRTRKDEIAPRKRVKRSL